ncbi:putative AP2-domain transcriptional [Staphylococcus phage vB_SauH_DELF3]|nr:putative AP2-domain transcriptional [Staphylococcus phage vB_SauH_DELF3]
MRYRCNNPNYHAYHRYGGRGIKVCKRWDDFNNFIKDMGKKPFKNAQLDRVDNNKGYAASTCKWTTPKDNANNQENRLKTNGYTRRQKKKKNK